MPSGSTGGLPDGFLGRVLDEHDTPVGSCWVAAAGVVVTARHVIAEATGVVPVVWQEQVPDAAGSSVRVEPLRPGTGSGPVLARVAAEDAACDVAVLVVPGGVWDCAAPGVGASDGVRRGELVKIAGFAVLEDPSRSAGLRFWETTGTWSGASMFEDAVALGIVDAKGVLQGLSGAPVVRRSDGLVVGVVSGRYNSTDGWARDTVWVARTEDLAALWGRTPGLDALAVSGQVELGEPAEVTLRVDRSRVSLTCPQLGVEASAPHGGLRPGLVSVLGDLRRARARHGSVRHDTHVDAAVSAVGASLAAVMEAMSASFLPGEVGQGWGRVFAAATQTTMPVRVAVDVREDGLRSLPWEALTAPASGGGVAVALHPLASVYRRAERAGTGRSVPGPLTIVVAIAAPIHSGGAVLDYEAELRNVLTAVKGARAGQARVRIVTFATTAAIRAALDDGDVHVLHLSGHGAPGFLVLEDDDGAARPVTAGQFVAEAIPPGKMPPVICLAACHTNVHPAASGAGNSSPTAASEAGTGDAVTAFASGLIEAGAPVVVGTETSVTDRYATRVFALLYDALAHDADPDPVTAVSTARRCVQDLFATSVDRRDQEIAGYGEWAVVSVQAATAGRVLFDPTTVPVSFDLRGSGAAYRRVGDLLALDPGVFVGRRREQHTLTGILTGRQDAEPAGAAGVVLLGIGGIGKTTLAAEVARRALEREPATVLVTFVGPVLVENVFTQTAAALRAVFVAQGILDRALPLLQALTQADQPWPDRLRILQQRVLDQLPILVVLDNFEDNLTDKNTDGVRHVTDPGLGELLASWATAPGKSRLLVTSRYPFVLPDGAEHRLHAHSVGPLSLAETMKLAWSLPRLDDLTDAQLQQVWAAVGGHPRTLETLDALLARGRARLPHIQKRLTDHLTQTLPGGPAAARAWLNQDRDLDGALADAVTIAADDILLPDLLATLHPDAVCLLAGLAVYREPIDANAVLYAVGTEDPTAADTPDRAAATRRVEDILTAAGIHPDTGGIDAADLDPSVLTVLTAALHEAQHPPTPPRATPLPLENLLAELTDATLLTRIPHDDGPAEWFAHRWTTTGLERHWAAHPTPTVQAAQVRHGRAADYWRWRVQVWPQDRDAAVHDLLEARHHHLAAGNLHDANTDTEQATSVLHERGAWDTEAALIADHLTRLPEDHPRRPAWYHQLGILAQDRGDYDTAQARYEQGLTIEERLGDQAGMASSYHQLGTLAQARGDYDTGQARYEQALTIFERLGDQAGMASSYHQLGTLAQARGDYDTAQARYEQSLTIKEQLGDQAGMASSYHQLGMLAQARGDYDTVQARYEQALTIFERLGNQAGMATGYHQLGMLAQARGDYDTAQARYEQSLTIKERLGNQAGMATSYGQLGILAYLRGDHATAQARYEQALTIFERLGDQAGMASSYHQLGMLAQARGDYDTAQARYEQSLTIKERLGNQAGMATSYGQLGMLAQARGDYDTAQARYEQALIIFERLGDQAGMATGYGQLGILTRERGDYDTAQARYEQALIIFERLGDQAGMATTTSQLGVLAAERDDLATAARYHITAFMIRAQIGTPQISIDEGALRDLDTRLPPGRLGEIAIEVLGAEVGPALCDALRRVDAE